MIRAVQEGQTETITTLLQNGANANLQMDDKTPLFWAVMENNGDAVKILLMYNADCNIPTITGITPLDLARIYRNQDMANLLIEAGAKEDHVEHNQEKPEIVVAADYGKTKSVDSLIKQGVNINAKNMYHDCALSVAAENGYVEIVILLLQAGAEVDIRDNYNKSPLYCAVSNDHYQVAKNLLTYGANPNFTVSKKVGGFTPLIEAVRNSNVQMVELLINNGADVERQTYEGETAISYAKRYNNKSIIALLSNAGSKNQETTKVETSEKKIIYTKNTTPKSVQIVFKTKNEKYLTHIKGKLESTLHISGADIKPVEPTLWIFRDVPPKYDKDVQQGGAYFKDINKWIFIRMVDLNLTEDELAALFGI